VSKKSWVGADDHIGPFGNVQISDFPKGNMGFIPTAWHFSVRKMPGRRDRRPYGYVRIVQQHPGGRYSACGGGGRILRRASLAQDDMRENGAKRVSLDRSRYLTVFCPHSSPGPADHPHISEVCLPPAGIGLEDSLRSATPRGRVLTGRGWKEPSGRPVPTLRILYLIS